MLFKYNSVICHRARAIMLNPIDKSSKAWIKVDISNLRICHIYIVYLQQLYFSNIDQNNG